MIPFIGVLDAVPLDENMQQEGVWSDHGIAFDALTEFVGYGELEGWIFL